MGVLYFSKTRVYGLLNREAVQRQACLGQLVMEEEEEEEEEEKEEDGGEEEEERGEIGGSNASVDENDMDRAKFREEESSALEGYVGDLGGVRYRADKVLSKPWHAHLIFDKKMILYVTCASEKQACMAFDCAARYTLMFLRITPSIARYSCPRVQA